MGNFHRWDTRLIRVSCGERVFPSGLVTPIFAASELNNFTSDSGRLLMAAVNLGSFEHILV